MRKNFLRRYEGQLVAVTLGGTVIVHAPSLDDLFAQLRVAHPREDYYIAKLGSETIGPLR